ncbi:MAG: quinone-dependent dihydroorotate dehydrogenase [Betaproteobacteria bacterium]
MIYPLFRPLLFTLDPETAHELAFASLDLAVRCGVASALCPDVAPSPVTAMGLAFPNRVGLAAGLDKNAAHIDGLAAFGFGFIECGTVTPRAQPGNPKPRMFRLPEAGALINRLGFNNEGVDMFLANAGRAAWRGILGLNIGKNFDTPNARAADDYLTCLRAVYARASYVTVNVSSPNTKGLRDLQSEEMLGGLIAALKAEQKVLADKHGKYTPIAVKIAPDLTPAAIDGIARILVRHGTDGVIATNTTLARDAVKGRPNADEAGGLSGRPLRAQATAVVARLATALDGALPIIGVGGIQCGADAKEKIDAGATLVQIYTGLIYRGPVLVAECARALADR